MVQTLASFMIDCGVSLNIASDDISITSFGGAMVRRNCCQDCTEVALTPRESSFRTKVGDVTVQALVSRTGFINE